MKTYNCNNCNFTEEYGGRSLPKSMQVPDDLKCPKCKEGDLVQKIESVLGIDVIGGYEYEYGNKSKLNNPLHKANVLSDNNVNPY